MPRPPMRTAVSATLRRLAGSVAGGIALAAGAAGLPTPAAAEPLVITEQLERAAFRAADLDGDGLLDEAELAADVIAAFVALDRDGNGVLTPDELVGVSEAAFARIDIDGSGTIELEELRLRKLNDFASADRDLDGRVSMTEMIFRPRRPQQ
jgi:Ca2+-binding EF-hand superfamily protein